MCLHFESFDFNGTVINVLIVGRHVIQCIPSLFILLKLCTIKK